MNDQRIAGNHIEITETLLRLYVFLAQELDRSLNQAARETFPEQELLGHLSTTRAKVMEILSVNPVVKEKVDKECQRVLALAAACVAERNATSSTASDVQAEQAVLKQKTIALSDLLAVFRATS